MIDELHWTVLRQGGLSSGILSDEDRAGYEIANLVTVEWEGEEEDSFLAVSRAWGESMALRLAAYYSDPSITVRVSEVYVDTLEPTGYAEDFLARA